MGKVKLVADELTVRLSPPLSCKTSPAPARPVTDPPMVKVEGAGGVELPDPHPTTAIKARAGRVKVANLFQLFILLMFLMLLMLLMTISPSINEDDTMSA